jgi:hypothetical protein
LGDRRNNSGTERHDGVGKCGNVVDTESLATARHGSVFQRLDAQAPAETVHGKSPSVCNRMKAAAAGAQTERPGAVADDGFA